jgi:hypothetical protein
LFEHHGVFTGSVEIEDVIFGLWTFEDPVTQALFVPLIEIAMVTAQEFGGKVFGLWNFLKDGVQANGAAKESAKIQYTPAFELETDMRWNMLNQQNSESFGADVAAFKVG